MAEIILHATPRPPQGTRPVRRLRAEGKVPGVVYGLGADPVTLSVEWRELRAALVTEQGLNAVIHLDIDGSTTPTLVKDLQRHKVRRDVLHVDFIRVDLDKPVEVEVPIHLEGEADAVTANDGVIDQMLTALLISAKPSDIPSGLTVDISDLEIGGAKRVGDIVLPAGVTTHVDAEEPVVTAAHGISEEELEAAAAEVAGEPEEGAEAEAVEGEEAEGAEAAEGEGAAEGGDGEGAAEGGDEG
ncbi:MAG: 50S ribosomal protein L25 [Acidimicrobiales bacterium]